MLDRKEIWLYKFHNNAFGKICIYCIGNDWKKKTDLRKQTSNQHFRKSFFNIFYISINASINLHSFLFSTYTKAISSITSCTKLYCRASSSVLWRSFGSGFSERKSKESLISKTAEINIVYQGLISFICYWSIWLNKAKST